METAPIQPTDRLEDALFRFLANQARWVLVPVLLTAGIIANLAAPYVPRERWLPWVIAIFVILVARATVIPSLARFSGLKTNGRLAVIVSLSLVHGLTWAYSLTFFVEMELLERAVQTMLLAGLCMGAVATTAGHLPFFVAFVIPIMLPLTILWLTASEAVGVKAADLSVAFSLLLFSAVLISVAIDTFQQFRRSFEINQQLREAIEAKSRVLASASHDLRQPMQALSASIDSLEMRNLDDASRSLVDDINAAKGDLSDLLRAILDISRLDAGVEDLTATNFNLHRLMFAVWDEYQPRAEKKGLVFELDCDEEAQARTNPVQFRRIISNLTSNAIRYTESGYVRLSVRRTGSKYTIDVTDTGVGIAESEQLRIFEDFYQVGLPERSQKRRGLGLGLSIVKRLTDPLGIELKLRSEPGRGSTFTVTVPIATGMVTKIEKPKEVTFEFDGLKVLVVDDEDSVASALKNMLESIQCEVRTADSTTAALQLAQEERPDVLLADRRLRGADDGLVLIKQLRKRYPDLPSILISGDTAPDRINEAIDAGIPSLVKPAQLHEIKRKIAEVCT